MGTLVVRVGGRAEAGEELVPVLAEDGLDREVEAVEGRVGRTDGDGPGRGGVARRPQRDHRVDVLLPALGHLGHRRPLPGRVGGDRGLTDQTAGGAGRESLPDGLQHVGGHLAGGHLLAGGVGVGPLAGLAGDHRQRLRRLGPEAFASEAGGDHDGVVAVPPGVVDGRPAAPARQAQPGQRHQGQGGGEHEGQVQDPAADPGHHGLARAQHAPGPPPAPTGRPGSRSGGGPGPGAGWPGRRR